MAAIVNRERVWKLESWITGALGAFLAELLIRTIYRTIRKDKAKGENPMGIGPINLP